MKKMLWLLLPLALLLAFHGKNSFTVKGKIIDDAGQAVALATVKEKGSHSATASDQAGNFTLVVSSDQATLEFSAVGYTAKSVKLKGKSNLVVKLTASQTQLQEVVVTTALGLKRENFLSGSAPGINVSNGYMSTQQDNYRQGRHANLTDSADKEMNTEDYDGIVENPFQAVNEHALSTFSIDVDAASYSNIRRFIHDGQLPPAGAVRIEEMINYFHYEYPQPQDGTPFTVNTEISDCPWNKDHRLVLIGLQGKKIPVQNLPASNLVFLIDVSGSMMDENKLPLVQQSMKMLVDQLRQEDKVSIVVYAGNAGLVLPPTNGLDKTKIKDAIDRLEAGGSTAGGEGILLAYKTAEKNFVKGGNNRVILCTDGDFNVGVSSDDGLERLIEEKRKTGVFLTVLGYGMGNYKDNKMQKLADKGNGNHAYIDGISEARKVLVNEFGGTLFTIAKDVKLQVEFNPGTVQGYRLIGYENRLLHDEDFNDDKKDAGELGSGHTVTALYEVIPIGVKDTFLRNIDPLRYQHKKTELGGAVGKTEIMNIKLRYKMPDGDESKLIEHPVIDQQLAINSTSDNFRFAASVAEFGMMLRSSAFRSQSSYSNILRLANSAKGKDEEGYRVEMIKMVRKAEGLVGEVVDNE